MTCCCCCCCGGRLLSFFLWWRGLNSAPAHGRLLCGAWNHQGWGVVGLYPSPPPPPPPPPLVRAPGKVVHDWNLTQNKQQGREGVRACVHACVRASAFFFWGPCLLPRQGPCVKIHYRL
jgi:hypothetical protein